MGARENEFQFTKWTKMEKLSLEIVFGVITDNYM